MEAVLPVEDVYFDPSIELTGDVSQMTAEEYLSWVRHQASQLPMYQRANVTSIPQRQSKYMPQVEEILSCPDSHLPDEEWEIDILHSFSELRLNLHRLSLSDASRERKEIVPQMKDRQAWYKFCLGTSSTTSASSSSSAVDEKAANDATLKRKRQLAEQLGIAMESTDVGEDDNGSEDGSNTAEGDDENEDAEEFPDVNTGLAHFLPGTVLPEWTGSSGVIPSTSVLLQFDQVLTQKVFSYLVDWLDDSAQLSSACSKWIYGLLARLEKPVCQSTVAIIRQLYRRCCALRHHLVLDQPSFDADLASLNILISITGSYFGQGEVYVSFNHKHTEVIRDASEEEEDEQEDGEESENLWDPAGGVGWEELVEEEEEEGEERVGSEKRMKLADNSNVSGSSSSSSSNSNRDQIRPVFGGVTVSMELEDGECT